MPRYYVFKTKAKAEKKARSLRQTYHPTSIYKHYGKRKYTVRAYKKLTKEQYKKYVR